MSKILHGLSDMKSIAQFLLKYLSCCLNCGSLLVSRAVHCNPCDNALRSLRTKGAKYEAPLKIHAYYFWNPGQSDSLSRLFISLKGGRTERFWRFYATRFMAQVIHSFPEDRPIYIVPAPSRTKGKKDHAFLWAQALAEACGGLLIPCLEKHSYSHQRFSDRGDRALIEMKLDEIYTQTVDFSDRALWIFADDILTTGSTARAAHKALGHPANFEVWVLAQRGLSCGASRTLL